MKTLTFVRHGESVSNAGGITMPHNEIPLSEFGRLQACKLSELLDVTPSAILVSRMIRTHQTAAPFSQRFSMRPDVHATLDEFSVIDPSLIEGLTGAERAPLVQSYWNDADPHRRLGVMADTFAEFEARVNSFIASMETLPDATVIFGHGIWFGLLLWRLLGYRAADASGMRAFRRFQLGLPMPNCAVFNLTYMGRERWGVQANADVSHRISLMNKKLN